GAAGKPQAVTRVQAFSLTALRRTADLAGPPPAGWKEYTPKDRAFVMWVPEKPARQTEEDRDVVVGGQRLRAGTVSGKTADGLSYEGQSAALPASFGRLSQKEVSDLFRGSIAADLKGRVTDSKEVEAGTSAGVEYVIEAGAVTTRVRVFVTAG